MLYLIYLGTFLKVFFNKMKFITDYLIDSYFSKFEVVPKFFSKIKKEMSFTVIKLYVEVG